MPTYQYLRGTGERAEIKSAIGYTLAIKKSDGTYDEVATRYKRHSLLIPGYINGNGKHEAMNAFCDKGGTLSITPMTRLTENGHVYYLEVSGYMTIEMVTSSNAIIPIPDKIYNALFEGTLYLDSYTPVTFSYGSLLLGTDGIYLQVKTSTLGNTYESIKVYDLTSAQKDNIKNVYFTNDYVTVTGVLTNVYHSSFIPLTVLTDDLNDACFGIINRNGLGQEEGSVYSKLAFYTAPSYSAFVDAANYDEIRELLYIGADETKEYLTVSDIREIAQNFSNAHFGGLAPGSPEAEKADIENWFVVFSSTRNETLSETNTDVVSIGKVFFPLFENDYAKLKGAGPYTLAVKALGDGVFFKDSEYSVENPAYYPTVS